ncbi:hypothetical protein GOBAR_DD20137 [Gossypium barbadense]|nr:hypothetical protein GOBAR_DD20137 [Gossypium barbadense]
MNDYGSLTGDCLRDGDGSNEDRNTKKVRFKEVDGNPIENMVMDVASVSGASWKDKLLGGVAIDEDLDFKEGDILRSTINGIPAIEFSDRVKKILVKDMETTVVLWTVEFNPLRPFPSVVLVWIQFPGLPGFLYKKRVLEEIGGLVGKVAKTDIKTDSGAKGRNADDGQGVASAPVVNGSAPAKTEKAFGP